MSSIWPTGGGFPVLSQSNPFNLTFPIAPDFSLYLNDFPDSRKHFLPEDYSLVSMLLLLLLPLKCILRRAARGPFKERSRIMSLLSQNSPMAFLFLSKSTQGPVSYTLMLSLNSQPATSPAPPCYHTGLLLVPNMPHMVWSHLGALELTIPLA